MLRKTLLDFFVWNFKAILTLFQNIFHNFSVLITLVIFKNYFLVSLKNANVINLQQLLQRFVQR